MQKVDDKAKNEDGDGESEVSCKKASKKFRLYPLFTPMLMELPDDPVKSDSTELENDILPSVQQKLQDDPSQEIQSTVIKAGKFTLEDSFRVLKLAMNQNTSVGFEERLSKIRFQEIAQGHPWANTINILHKKYFPRKFLVFFRIFEILSKNLALLR